MTYFDFWYIKWYRESGILDSFNNSKLKKECQTIVQKKRKIEKDN